MATQPIDGHSAEHRDGPESGLEDDPLFEMRQRLDAIDQRLMATVRDRLSLCGEIAKRKRTENIPMYQPERVGVVHDNAQTFAREHGLSPSFMRSLYDLIISEACRLEDVIIEGKARQEATSTKLGAYGRCIDHVAIAVLDLESAISYFRDRYGFTLCSRRDVSGVRSGMISAEMRAGGVTFVLCQGTSDDSNVSQYIKAHGPGVQHIAIEVDSIATVLEDLKTRQVDLLTDLLVGDGLSQAFTRRERNTGVQLEFISRSANDRFDDQNVQKLFEAMEKADTF